MTQLAQQAKTASRELAQLTTAEKNSCLLAMAEACGNLMYVDTQAVYLRAALDAGYDLDRILTTTDLVSGEEVFFAATGISDGDLLKGVHYRGDGATTESLVMRAKSGTIRTIRSEHRWQKLMRYSAVKFD